MTSYVLLLLYHISSGTIPIAIDMPTKDACEMALSQAKSMSKSLWAPDGMCLERPR